MLPITIPLTMIPPALIFLHPSGVQIKSTSYHGGVAPGRVHGPTPHHPGTVPGIQMGWSEEFGPVSPVPQYPTGSKFNTVLGM